MSLTNKQVEETSLEIVSNSKTLGDILVNIKKIKNETDLVKISIAIGYLLKKYNLIGDDNDKQK